MREAKVGRTEHWTEALIARGTLRRARRDILRVVWFVAIGSKVSIDGLGG